MNELSTTDRVRILNCLIEGMSVRATSRITGAAKGTILRLVRTVGPACREFMDRYFVDLPCEHTAMFSIWAFYYNLVRKHSTLRGKTPAMAAGITEHALTLRDMLFATDQALAS